MKERIRDIKIIEIIEISKKQTIRVIIKDNNSRLCGWSRKQIREYFKLSEVK